ncbi:MAG: serine--tRNA ligase [Chloroflexi bacterium]|nr:serine--tRNA ligase [Ardenticatenaceae bacterium]MBL1128300.1 serine--tRNA ligase [Chloroflexota bacterium]NOG34373.1 serine--tRNA ligase [Chloroflexota bacterium]GIK57374.1 MAG: serine--tRNA ligase [Chloroflexota bacterium]
MLDINLIREKPEWVKAQTAKRNTTAPVDEILADDGRRREIILEVEELRRQRNESSKQIGAWMGSLKKLEADLKRAEAGQYVGQELAALQTQLNAMQFNVDEAKADTGRIGDRIAELDEELRQVEARLRDNMLWVPNIVQDSVPVGPDESANVFHPPQGAPKPVFDFEPKAHWDLGPALDIIDFERGVKLSGSRFYILKGMGARLQRAVIQFMLNYHLEHHGYTEIQPPYMVRSAIFEGAGQLPKFFDNIYRDAEEDFMWLGTAEIALTNLHRDEILAEEMLPLKYVSYTPCWRREKMSAGKDVRGIKRGHEFHKVEMYQFTHPDKSLEAHEEMKQHALDICDALGFHYRLVDLCTGDVGFAMSKTYDIEVWAAGCGEWLEVSSISNATDFQARRANVRYKPADGGKTRFPHTLNASGLALPRVMIALIENNQQADGSVVVPEVLRPYMGGVDVIR